MRALSYLLLLVLTGLLIGCKELTPQLPPNPVVGNWEIDHWDMYDLPAWFVAKPRAADIEITPTDTMTFNGTLASLYSVHSFTFTANNVFSELYPIPYVDNGVPGGQVDKGNWTFTDSVVNLRVPNMFPHKLTYSAATDQLHTDRVAQTSVLRFGSSDIRDTVRLSYTMRVFYRRSP